MFIKKLQVFNYKSYFDSGVMEFAPGMNIIVGRNNAGKTSLLEVLTLDFEDHPHRSLKGSIPLWQIYLFLTVESGSYGLMKYVFSRLRCSRLKESHAEISLLFDKEELVNLIKQLPPPLGLPFPYDDGQGWWYNGEPEEAGLLVERFQELLDTPPIELKLPLFSKSNIEVQNNTISTNFNFDLYPPASKNENGKFSFVQINYSSKHNKFYPIYKYGYRNEYSDMEELIDFEIFEGTNEQTIGYQIFNIFKKRIYRFKAERLNIGVCKSDNVTNFELKSDASNLAEVLCILQGASPGKFEDFNNLISSILPEIKWISVVPRDNSKFEILVWMIERNLNRDDLSLPLSLCGSGVSQVLAIVYILVSSEEPRTIIIDEPQSFLHPGAAKKLIETIKQFPQHQYFIATHSPDIITTADPSKIINLEYKNCETTASPINPKEENKILMELGVRLSDVFGADNILWVEGKTEEICFPLILEKVLHKQLRGTKILSVINPGDFQGTRAKIIFDIYQKLSGGTHLFPPAIGFLFDREKRTEEDKRKWQDISKKPVEFLSRRMYENYLLDSEAIAAVLNEDNQSRPEPFPIHLTSAEVEEWLEKKKQEKGCSEEEWLSEVDGSNLLKDLFTELSGSRLKFHKTRQPYNHSYKLTEWLVKYKPDFLLGLAEEVAKMLNY